MKTKLTLNIDDKIIARAKRESAKRCISLSSIVEDYLDRFSNQNGSRKLKKSDPSLLERIRKYTHAVEKSDEEIEKMKEEYMKEKYGL
jgi:hypothetical protein